MTARSCWRRWLGCAVCLLVACDRPSAPTGFSAPALLSPAQGAVLDNPRFHDALHRIWESREMTRAIEEITPRLEPMIRRALAMDAERRRQEV